MLWATPSAIPGLEERLTKAIGPLAYLKIVEASVPVVEELAASVSAPHPLRRPCPRRLYIRCPTAPNSCFRLVAREYSILGI